MNAASKVINFGLKFDNEHKNHHTATIKTLNFAHRILNYMKKNRNWEQIRIKLYLLQQLLGVVVRQGRLRRGNRLAAQLGEGERAEIRDEDAVERVGVPHHVLAEVALDLLGERVPRAEVAEEVGAAHGEDPAPGTRFYGEAPRGGESAAGNRVWRSAGSDERGERRCRGHCCGPRSFETRGAGKI